MYGNASARYLYSADLEGLAKSNTLLGRNFRAMLDANSDEPKDYVLLNWGVSGGSSNMSIGDFCAAMAFKEERNNIAIYIKNHPYAKKNLNTNTVALPHAYIVVGSLYGGGPHKR